MDDPRGRSFGRAIVLRAVSCREVAESAASGSTMRRGLDRLPRAGARERAGGVLSRLEQVTSAMMVSGAAGAAWSSSMRSSGRRADAPSSVIAWLPAWRSTGTRDLLEPRERALGRDRAPPTARSPHPRARRARSRPGRPARAGRLRRPGGSPAGSRGPPTPGTPPDRRRTLAPPIPAPQHRLTRPALVARGDDRRTARPDPFHRQAPGRPPGNARRLRPRPRLTPPRSPGPNERPPSLGGTA